MSTATRMWRTRTSKRILTTDVILNMDDDVNAAVGHPHGQRGEPFIRMYDLELLPLPCSELCKLSPENYAVKPTRDDGLHAHG